MKEPSNHALALQTTAVEESNEIDLLELFYAMLQSWKFILPVIMLAVLFAWLYTTQFVTPMFESTSKLYVLSAKDSVINLSDLQVGSQLTNDYQEVFNAWEVHDQVKKNLKLDFTNDELQKMITVNNPMNTRILEITARSPNPGQVADLANEYARVAQKYISDYMQADEPSILSVARTPDRPSSPSLLRNLVLGFVLGMLLSLGVVLLRFMLDDRLKTAEDISKYTGLPTLAIVPMQKRAVIAKRTVKKRRARKSRRVV